MSDYKLTFKLKQHTPIIHFQHEQHGATLRASELKPKLDKYLIKKFQEDSISYEKWLTRKEEPQALDYKVKIISNSQKITGVENNKTFFGGIGHKGEKEYEWDDNPIDLLICAFNCSLIKEIEKYFSYFIAETNFGTRQNKGNGSFYIDRSDTEHFKNIEKILPGETFYISIKEKDNQSIFKTIDYYYRRLKAGINLSFDNRCNGEYSKSFLYKFYNEKTKKGWEKRYIKEEFFGLYNDKIDKYFVRALLGLPGSFTFKKTKEPCHKKSDKKITSTYEILDDYEIEVHHPDIERYKSPISFKPIIYPDKTKIFILPGNDVILNTSQKFILYKKFIAKKIYQRNGRFKTEQKILPERLGTEISTINLWATAMTAQENSLPTYSQTIEQLLDYREKNKLKKYIDNYITGQKSRFENYLKECITENGYYIPPHCEIEMPDTNLDLEELIKKYNKEELKDSFTTENISATINVTKQ